MRKKLKTRNGNTKARLHERMRERLKRQCEIKLQAPNVAIANRGPETRNDTTTTRKNEEVKERWSEVVSYESTSNQQQAKTNNFF